jgi:hypothetical protein
MQKYCFLMFTIFCFWVPAFVQTYQSAFQRKRIKNRKKIAQHAGPHEKRVSEISWWSQYMHQKRRKEVARTQTMSYFLRNALCDIVQVNLNLIAWDSFKVVAGTLPLFIGARMIDEKVQRNFYDTRCHKNLNQPPGWSREIARLAAAPIISFLGLQAILSRNEEVNATGRAMIFALPVLFFANQLIKKMDFDACLRPWHEKFSPERRSSGGCPSGHLSEISFLTVLYGMRFGPIAWVPLGLVSLGIAGTFLACNRHYLSQLIAGVGFGTMYALAADKLVTDTLRERINMRIGLGHCGPSVGFSLCF